MLRTKKKLERDCTDLNLNWFGNFKSEIKCVLDEASVNSRRDTYRVVPTRFLLLHLADRRIHPYTKLKISTAKSSEEIFYAFELQRVIKEDGVYRIGSDVPKESIVFFTQVILIYVKAITSIVNLTMETKHDTLWTSLLSASFGHMLLAPQLNNHKKQQI